MKSRTDVPEFGSIADAAALFGVGEHAIRTGIRTGQIPATKIGRSDRIPLRMMMDRIAAEVEQSDAPGVESRGTVETLPVEGVST